MKNTTSRLLLITSISLATVFTLVSTPALAQSESECRERVMTSMDNAAKLGGSDADKMRWAQIAADECYKEAASKGRASSSANDSPPGPLAYTVLILGILGAIIFGGLWLKDKFETPLLADKSPHYEELMSALSEAMAKIKTSQWSELEKADRKAHLLKWSHGIRINNGWTVKSFYEYLENNIMAGFAPAEPKASRAAPRSKSTPLEGNDMPTRRRTKKPKGTNGEGSDQG